MKEQVTSPAPIPTESTTQPMGPLREEDQAAVDAINALPEGKRVAVEPDVSYTSVLKESGAVHDSATTVSYRQSPTGGSPTHMEFATLSFSKPAQETGPGVVSGGIISDKTTGTDRIVKSTKVKGGALGTKEASFPENSQSSRDITQEVIRSSANMVENQAAAQMAKLAVTQKIEDTDQKVRGAGDNMETYPASSPDVKTKKKSFLSKLLRG